MPDYSYPTTGLYGCSNHEIMVAYLSRPKEGGKYFPGRSHGSDVPGYHGDICVVQLMDGLHGNVCSVGAIVLELVIQRVGEFIHEVLQLPYILHQEHIVLASLA